LLSLDLPSNKRKQYLFPKVLGSHQNKNKLEIELELEIIQTRIKIWKLLKRGMGRVTINLEQTQI
jgi:hypothetical protein